ncbi:nephrin-like isoform X2 [Cherax quadricarinatus]|uniref:nephrin-like isoform X2 n=1 Tax=Cherax quadricarinatus TaxID=27406 RepID=UPI00387EA6AE
MTLGDLIPLSGVAMWKVVIISVLTAVSNCLEIKRIPVMAVTGVTGGEVALPCDVSHPANDAIYLMLWFREPLTTPIYRLDERSETETRWSDDLVLGRRASLELGSPEVSGSPAVLRVTSLTSSDQGLYTCRVDFRLQPTKTTRVNLTVIVPPEGVNIVGGLWNSAPRGGGGSVAGPYLLGDTIILTCVARGGTPPPVVLWHLGSHLLDAHMESSPPQAPPTPLLPGFLTTVMPSEGKAFNTLTLGPLTRSHLLQELMCEASNTNLTGPAASTLTIDMNLPPLSVKISPPADLPLKAGREYLVGCQVLGARPPPTLTWWTGHQRVLQATVLTSEDSNVTSSRLMLLPRSQDHGSSLRCIAETFASPATMEDSWHLDVHYVPKVRLRYGASLDAESVKEGDDVYFECFVEANPPASRISWRHDNWEISQNVSGGVILSNQTLVLQRLLRTQAGQYSCYAHNTEGVGTSNTLTLDVKYAPVCSPGQVTSYAVERYEDAEVTCSVEANPVQKSFQWTFNNTADAIDVPRGRFTSSSNPSVITYTPMTSLDYGTLLCWAFNEIGTQREPCVFHIVPAGKPEPPWNCTVSGVSRTSVRVGCEAGNSGGLPQHFLLQATSLHHHHQGGLHHLNFTGSVSPEFYVTGLQEGGKYQLVVRAVNDKGTSSGTLLTVTSIGTNGSLYQVHDGPLEAEVRESGQTSVTQDIPADRVETHWGPLALSSLMLGALGMVSGLLLLAVLVLVFVTIRSSTNGGGRRRIARLRTQQLLPLSETLCHAGVVGSSESGSSAHYDSLLLSPVLLLPGKQLGSTKQETSSAGAQVEGTPAAPPATLLPPHEYSYEPIPAHLHLPSSASSVSQHHLSQV